MAILKNFGPDPSNLRMVEYALDRHIEFETKNDLLCALPNPVSSKELDQTLDHLEKSHKIIYDKENMVWFCYASPKLQKILDNA